MISEIRKIRETRVIREARGGKGCQRERDKRRDQRGQLNSITASRVLLIKAAAASCHEPPSAVQF